MASPQNAWPDDWTTDGVVPTDILLDDVESLTGEDSIKFPSGGGDVALYSAWYATGQAAGASDFAAPKQGTVYAVAAGDSVTAGDNLTVTLQTTPDFGTITDTVIFDGVLNSAGKFWDGYGKVLAWPTGAAWTRIKVSRSSGRAWDLWIDRVYLNLSPPGIFAPDTLAGTFAATWTAVTLVATLASRVRVSSGSAVVSQPGWYNATGGVFIDDTLAAGDSFGCRLSVNSTRLGGVVLYPGSAFTSHGVLDTTTNKVGLVAAANWIPLDSGDTVDLEIIQYTNTGALKDFDVAMLTLALASPES